MLRTYGVIGMLDRMREPRLDGIEASRFKGDAGEVEALLFCASSLRN